MEVAQYAILGLFWLWFLVVTANFFNFMDGINGMAGLSGTVGFGLLAFFAYLHDADSWQFILPICLAAACLGFLPFNFPRARIFFGDVGSILIGFLFALLVAVLAVDISSFLILAGCLLPIYADASFTLFYRWRRQENLLVAHRQHLYQMLVHTGGFPHWQVSLFYALLQLITGLFLIVGEKAWGEGFVIALFLTIILGFLVFGISVRRGALGVPTLFSLEAKK
jgi:Fuc2NAc and GlcNAc transferase